MIVKIVIDSDKRHETEVMFDNITQLTWIEHYDPEVCYGEDQTTVLRNPDARTADSIRGIELLFQRDKGPSVLLLSDYKVFVMNDSGKTIQTYYPTYESEEPVESK